MILEPGQEIAGRYEIIEKIGSGGMANVYRAMDKKLRRFVTFKVMRQDYVTDQEFIGRFNVEARAAASLSNQHIVNVYDVGQEEDIHYIVMEYVDGVTLKDLIKKRAPFDNEELLGVAIQIATALEHAHSNNIVHRDIKPQNILVTKAGISKVTDFGIARASASTTMTTTNSTMGSVHYFSPEQARGGYVDAKSDIYSLGVVMYEMATGQMPFDGDTPISIALKHINEPLPDMKGLNPKLSEKIIEIITKATEKLSNKRYQTVGEMANELKRTLTNAAGESKVGIYQESPTIKLSEADIEEIQREAMEKMLETKVPQPRPRVRLAQEDIEDEPDEGIFSNRLVVIGGVVTGLIIVLAISAFIFNFLNKQKTPNPVPVSLPNLTNISLADAEEVAALLGISIGVEGTVADDNIPEGYIVSYDVGTDGEIYEGEILGVVVSLGTDKFPVPDVKNMEISAAYKEFEEKNYPLETHEEREWHDSIPQNVIIRQEPEGGTMVDANTKVTLYISNGVKEKTARVPNLKGMTEAAAISVLKELGLQADHAVKASSETVPMGLIVDQMVDPDTELPRGTPVQFVVSTGPAQQATPSPSPAATNAPKTSTRNLEIELTNVPEDVESVQVLVIKSTAKSNTEIYNGMVKISELPLKLSVTGEGEAEIIVFTVDENGQSRAQGSQYINFSDETNEEEAQ